MTHEYARASFNLHCSSCSSSSYCSSGSLVGEAEAGALGSTGFSPSALNKQVILTLSKQLQLGNFQLQTWALNEAQFDKDIIFFWLARSALYPYLSLSLTPILRTVSRAPTSF